MRIRAWWDSLSFFWQVYLFMILSIGAIITLIEGLIEPLADSILQTLNAGHPFAYEALVWAVGTFLPSLLIGLLITNMVVVRLNALELATRTLSNGDLRARVRDTANENDVFTKLGRNFNAMAESLEQLIVNGKRLLADISHELRSPLTRMNLGLALLQKYRYENEFEPAVGFIWSHPDWPERRRFRRTYVL